MTKAFLIPNDNHCIALPSFEKLIKRILFSKYLFVQQQLSFHLNNHRSSARCKKKWNYPFIIIEFRFL